MFYIYLKDNIASESIPEYIDIFPGMPIAKRYSAEFLSQCVTSVEEIPAGYIYNPETNAFREPPPEPEIPYIAYPSPEVKGTEFPIKIVDPPDQPPIVPDGQAAGKKVK